MNESYYGVWVITEEGEQDHWLWDTSGIVFSTKSFAVALAQAETVKRLHLFRAVDAGAQVFGSDGQPLPAAAVMSKK